MQLILKRVWVLLAIGMGLGLQARAQEVLTGDAGLPAGPVLHVARQTLPRVAAKVTALSLPFFDDFSRGAAMPDTSLWLLDLNSRRWPAVSIAKGHNLPSKGVATFDGANANGLKYSALFGTGETDTLTSQAIDLSGHSPADSLVLSFFVERGGAGEAPETTDSLVLLFDTTGNFEFTQVWGLKGASAGESRFQYFTVVLDSARYFHPAFHFKFAAFGSLNGELDQFHLDYVRLAAGRSVLDSTMNDVSPLRIHTSPFDPYTAVPRKQVRRSNVMQAPSLIVSNAGYPAASPSFSLGIDDPVGGNPFAGTTLVSASAPGLAAFGTDTAQATAFSEQGAAWGAYGAVRLQASKTGAADLHPENDTLSLSYRVDSILALDDAVSDIGYGLTAARAFCQEYEIDQSDTLVAVWIRFTSAIHYNQPVNLSTDLTGKGFRLVVWDSLAVDSSLLETSGGMNVAYGNSLNEFVRYPLIREVEVPTRFWIGIRQSDGMAIGMALDRSSSTTRRVYFEDATAEFVLSSHRGALMMRPEFKVPAASVGVQEPRGSLPLVMAVGPNPLQGDVMTVTLPDGASLRDARWVMRDLQGRPVAEWQSATLMAQQRLELPSRPTKGLYLLELQARDGHGQPCVGRAKILIHD